MGRDHFARPNFCRSGENMKAKDIGLSESEACPIRHIAFIMDGNGRWAKRRGMPREFGHKAGAEVFKKIMRYCGKVGIEAATFYAFSTENWKRPKREVDAIMGLLAVYLDECKRELETNNMRIVFLGDKSIFTEAIRRKMTELEEISKKNSYIVNIAMNYGGRDEIAYAANKLISEGKSHVTEEDISSALYTKDSPEVDMIVRTGGDLRISNFLLWQAAYAELYFTDKYWPDLTERDVDDIIEVFKSRKRRFGGV